MRCLRRSGGRLCGPSRSFRRSFNRKGSAALLLLLQAGCFLLQAGCIVDQPPGSATAGSNHAPTPSPSPRDEAPAPTAASADKLERYLQAIRREQAPEVQAALSRMEGLARQVLALRGYLLAGSLLRDRWAWTAEEVGRYQTTPEYGAALAEVEKVRQTFAGSNPGYTLDVNTEVRTLEQQLKNWNEADSVRAAGEELLDACRREVAGSGYGEEPEEGSRARLEKFLRGSRPARVPTVAVPGLSPHGQLRAFDFQVRQNGKLIAGTNTSSVEVVWERGGWSARLKEAVTKSGARLKGPLTSPREPWHYTHTP